MEQPPNTKTIGDGAHAISRALLSAIPAFSGPLVALFDNLFTAPLTKRKNEWLLELSKVITEIQETQESTTIEKLSQNEVFITACLQASQIALRNHKKEKILALRNALFNSVQPKAPGEDKQLFFLRLIDELTPWHLLILGFLNNPSKWMLTNGKKDPEWYSGDIIRLMNLCLPEMEEIGDFIDQLVRDLQNGGLLSQGNYLNSMMSSSGIFASRTSPIGKEFIAFISRE